MTNLHTYRDSMKRTATFIGRYLTPDGDWQPVIMYEVPSGTTRLIDSPGIAGPRRLEELKTVAEILQRERAVAVTIVHAGWMLDGVTDEQMNKILAGEAPGARDDENHVEVVHIFGFDREGNGISSVAKVERTKTGPPRLGEWNDTDDGSRVAGDYAELLRWAVGAA